MQTPGQHGQRAWLTCTGAPSLPRCLSHCSSRKRDMHGLAEPATVPCAISSSIEALQVFVAERLWFVQQTYHLCFCDPQPTRDTLCPAQSGVINLFWSLLLLQSLHLDQLSCQPQQTLQLKFVARYKSSASRACCTMHPGASCRRQQEPLVDLGWVNHNTCSTTSSNSLKQRSHAPTGPCTTLKPSPSTLPLNSPSAPTASCVTTLLPACHAAC